MSDKLMKVEQTKDELISVLQASLYVGAKRESVELVLGYCEATNLDPMMKPVHIVPMSVKKASGQGNEFRDVIMPGIGLYRIQADRSGTMAGITEPEYGPMITQTFKTKGYDNNPSKDIDVTYPEWCKIIVKKVVGPHIVDFVAKEYWIENYATAGGNATAPNAMWMRRSRGQLAKCAEAQALRKAFPEIGAQPTAEEMEGKMIDVTEPVEVAEVVNDGSISDDRFEECFPEWEKRILAGKKTAKALIQFLEKKGTILDETQRGHLFKVEESVK